KMNGSTELPYVNTTAIAERWNMKCAANLAEYALEKNEVKRDLMKFMFPVQFTIAIAGNLLTLAVLLSGTSNRANRLLTCLAVCDCCVFLSLVIDSLITFEAFYVIPSVRVFYFENLEYIAFLCNWFTAASVWFVLAISVERLLIIKFPFRSLNNNQNRQVLIIACGIMLLTFCTCQVMRFTNYCIAIRTCNGTEIKGACFPSSRKSDMNHIPEWIVPIVPSWMIFNTFLVVIIPVAVVITINIQLLRIVKRSNKQELVRTASAARPRRSDEQEKSMTRAIVAIVTCFSVTQGPSGLLYLASNVITLTTGTPPIYLMGLMVYTNVLVLTGKMLNFVLFCLTSATFRVRLLNTMTMWCYKLGLVQRPVLNRDASRTLLTAKSSVASYHWKGRYGQDDYPMATRNGNKKKTSTDSMSNNNVAARINNNNPTQRSSGSRSSLDSGNARPLFMTSNNHSLEKEPFVESTKM
ncbi:hypothetical protein PENTCL1PPCAC_14606, partial [Pristionchus entomophagus]